MKKLIDITDEDAIAVIDCIHILTDNNIVSRDGELSLSFEESFQKYGSASILFECVSSSDIFGDSISHCKIVFRHTSVWFAELGYSLPSTPQW